MLFLEHFRTIVILCLSIFGCAGNLLTLLIVNRRFFRKTASGTFISALSIADAIVLCLHSLQIVTKLRPHVTSYDCLLFYLMDVFRLLSLWIVCLINIERCSLVFNPCQLPRLTSRLKSYLLVGTLFVLSLLIFSHYGRHMTIEYEYAENGTQPIRSMCMFKADFHQFTWQMIRSALNYWSVVPLCIICNFIIIRRLHQASRIERNNNPNCSSNKLFLSTKQRQLTGMLVASSICFICTTTPSTVQSIYLLISHDLSNRQYIIHIFTNILLHFHHASNFLVFMFSCVRFRIELIEMFRIYCRCRFYSKWYKRSTLGTEQIILNSNKQQKIPMRLLTYKSNTPRRSLPHQSPNGIVLLGYNQYPRRAYRHGMQAYGR